MLGEDKIAVIGLARKHPGAARAAGSGLAGARHVEAMIAQDLENRAGRRYVENRAGARQPRTEKSPCYAKKYGSS